MTEREEFELFWKENMNVEAMPLYKTSCLCATDEKQQYICHETNIGWITWQAAKSHGSHEGYSLIQTWMLNEFPEINLSNYGHDEVEALNAWGVDIVTSSAPEQNK